MQDAWTGNTTVQDQGWTDLSWDRLEMVFVLLLPLTVTQNLGDRVVGVNFVHLLSRDVSFTARGMRPNTRVYAFFDNEDINTYITPSGSLGGNIVTDANGRATGTFSIPDPNVDANPRWRTGKRVFRLTSSSTNSADKQHVATSAEADYVARGLQETIRNVVTSTKNCK